MADKTTKLLLALIALGLWANVLTQHPQRAVAQDLGNIEHRLANIEDGVYHIETGDCRNKKLC
jgi:hypothetical protein